MPTVCRYASRAQGTVYQVHRNLCVYNAKLTPVSESLGSGCVAEQTLRSQDEAQHIHKGAARVCMLLCSLKSVRRLASFRSSAQNTWLLGHLRDQRLYRAIESAGSNLQPGRGCCNINARGRYDGDML